MMVGGTITGVDIPPAPERASRPALERMLALAPWLVDIAAPVIARLPPTSRLRRRALTETFSRAFAAINRGDPWFVTVAYEPDCEIRNPPEMRSVGAAGSYRGHAGWREANTNPREAFAELHITPEHLIDLGDRWVARLAVSATGHASGVPTHQLWGSVYDVSSRGRITRQEFFWTWEGALAAAGLRGAADAVGG